MLKLKPNTALRAEPLIGLRPAAPQPYPAVLADEVQTGVDEPLEHGVGQLPALLPVHLREDLQPGLDQRAPAQRDRLQVHHAAATHCGRLQADG